VSELRYRRGPLCADLARAGAGAACTGAPLALATTPAWLTVTLAVLLALFAAHLAATVRRARVRIEIDERGLRLLPAGTRIAWDQLDALHLDYYSTRRDGRGGWMQLRLRAGGARLRVDSSLCGFEHLLARALFAARERGLELSPATRANAAGLHGAREGASP